MTEELTVIFNQFNAGIEALAKEESNGNSQVVVVDMSGILTDADFADDVHYNASGAKKVADRYFAVLSQVLQ